MRNNSTWKKEQQQRAKNKDMHVLFVIIFIFVSRSIEGVGVSALLCESNSNHKKLSFLHFTTQTETHTHTHSNAKNDVNAKYKNQQCEQKNSILLVRTWRCALHRAHWYYYSIQILCKQSGIVHKTHVYMHADVISITLRSFSVVRCVRRYVCENTLKTECSYGHRLCIHETRQNNQRSATV